MTVVNRFPLYQILLNNHVPHSFVWNEGQADEVSRNKSESLVGLRKLPSGNFQTYLKNL